MHKAIDLLEEYGTEKMILGSADDWNPSAPVAVPKARAEMLDRDWDRGEVRKVVLENPQELFRHSPAFQCEL